MSALESSVTLEDVFMVVGARRVPLAPELAGYLALEIAEGAGASEVDPRSVYIGDEGTVALVKPRGDARTGDAEASIRLLLARLLEASGSQTAALAAVARRRGAAGLPALVEELEAALIPVNRAAGRRALARLAREAKRVTLGVGRNAALAPNEPAREPVRRGSSPSHRAPMPTPGGPEREPPPPDSSDLPTREVRKEHVASVLAAHAASQAQPGPAVREPQPTPAPVPPSATPPPGRPRAASSADDVDHLLASFGVSQAGEKAHARELKALIGLEPTPPPPEQGAHASRDSEVEALLAISDPGTSPKATAVYEDRQPPAIEREYERPMPPKVTLDSPPTAISPALANEPIARAAAAAAARAQAAASPRVETPPTLANAGALPTPAPPASAVSPSEPVAPARPDPRTTTTGPALRRGERVPTGVNNLREYREPQAPRTDRALLMIALFVLLAGAAAIYVMKPGFIAGHHAPAPGAPSTRAPAPAASSAASAATAPAKCRESLVITGAPPGSEILLRVGQAPVDVERMPVGARLEFVATAEGFAPKRAVIPGGATWDPGPDGKPRYEVGVQLDKSKARPGPGGSGGGAHAPSGMAVDSWPPAEPGSDVGGKGSPGTVHLVSTPRGAEVWLLAGLGPDTRIDELPLSCTNDVDVLVAGPTTLRKRVHVAQADFVATDGGAVREATVSVK